MAWAWLVLWPNHGLDVDSPGDESRTVLYPICGMIVWLVMACRMAWFRPIYGLVSADLWLGLRPWCGLFYGHL